MTHGGLTLERYAAIGAALRYFPRGRKALVFERVAITQEAWDAARVAWSTALEASSADGGTLLAEWSAAFEEAGQKLREAAPSLDSFELALLLPAEEPALAAPAAVDPDLVPPPPAPAPERPRELPSYLAAASGAAPTPPKPPPITGEIPAAGVARGVLPFGAPLSAASIAVAPPVAPTSIVTPRAPMAQTADLEAMPKKPRPRTMPFTIPTTPTPPPRPGSPAPLAPPPPPPTASLTFNQYAALKAELSAFPNDAELIWSKYGVPEPAAREHVEQHWVATLAADPRKQQHFNAVFSQYLEQWARKR